MASRSRQGLHIPRKQPTDSSEQASWTTAIGTAVPSPAIPTSGEAIAPTRNEEVPSSAEADPAACGVRIRACALVFGSTRPIADISTNSAAAIGTSPTSPNTPVDISSSATEARVMVPSPLARALSRLTRPTSSLPLIWPTAIRPTELRPNSRLNACGEAP